MKINIQFKPTAKILWSANRDINKESKIAFLFYVFFLGVPLLLAIASHFSDNLSWEMYLLLISCIFYVYILLPIIQYMNARKALGTNKSASAVQNYEISDVGIKNYGDGFEVILSWGKINKVVQTKKYMLFFISAGSAYYVPISYFSSDEINIIKEWSAKA